MVYICKFEGSLDYYFIWKLNSPRHYKQIEQIYDSCHLCPTWSFICGRKWSLWVFLVTLLALVTGLFDPPPVTASRLFLMYEFKSGPETVGACRNSFLVFVSNLSRSWLTKNQSRVQILYYPLQASAALRVFFSQLTTRPPELIQKSPLLNSEHHISLGEGNQRKPKYIPCRILLGLSANTIFAATWCMQPVLGQSCC